MKCINTAWHLLVGYTLLLHVHACVGALVGSDHVFVKGAPLVGGSQGMYFDRDNHLIVAQVYGRAISTLNAETGEILQQLGFDDASVAFVDDVVVGPGPPDDDDETLYWSDSFYFKTIFARPPGGPSVPLLPIGSVPFANPVTLSDDGTRLFYAQCWNPTPENGVYELNLETNTTTTILDGIFGCASNAMDFRDEFLYTPRPYEGRIVKIDLLAGDDDNNSNYTISNVTTGWGGAPQALKFDSMGRLYATNSGNGQVAVINLTNPDTDNNREIIATFPPGWVDNLAFDKDDRLYISSTSDATIVELLLPSNNTRIVSPGEGFAVAMGLAMLNHTYLFTVDPGAVVGFNVDTGEKITTIRAKLGVEAGTISEPTSVAVWDENLVLMSLSTGVLEVFDPFTETSVLSTFFAGPIDAHPFQGGLLVTESATGSVVLASGPDLGSREIIVNTSAPAFLAGDDKNVYLTDVLSKTVFQIIANGTIVSPPGVIATGFEAPEGIALRGDDTLLVVDGGRETLEAVNLLSGEVETIATDLGFFPGIPGLAIGFANDVVVDDNGAVYVNGDRANVIYKFPAEKQDTSTSRSDRVPPTLFHSRCRFRDLLCWVKRHLL
jgi:sugar lactone lactonase YvrE